MFSNSNLTYIISYALSPDYLGSATLFPPLTIDFEHIIPHRVSTLDKMSHRPLRLTEKL